MSAYASGVTATDPARSSQATNEALAALGSSDFLKLLITQLTHQDPTAPMENKEILEQLTALRSLESNTQLTQTIRDLAVQDQIGTAAGLIGRDVYAVMKDGTAVMGRVRSVLISQDGTRLAVQGPHDLVYSVGLDNVLEITEGGSSGDTSGGD